MEFVGITGGKMGLEEYLKLWPKLANSDIKRTKQYEIQDYIYIYIEGELKDKVDVRVCLW